MWLRLLEGVVCWLEVWQDSGYLVSYRPLAPCVGVCGRARLHCLQAESYCCRASTHRSSLLCIDATQLIGTSQDCFSNHREHLHQIAPLLH